MHRLKRLLLVLYLLGNCSMRYSTSYIPVVVHGPDQSIDRFPVSPSPSSRAPLR